MLRNASLLASIDGPRRHQQLLKVPAPRFQCVPEWDVAVNFDSLRYEIILLEIAQGILPRRGTPDREEAYRHAQWCDVGVRGYVLHRRLTACPARSTNFSFLEGPTREAVE
ncbi:MAG: hypothetical protein ABL973_03975 [Micropepsaceae bacterium]